MRFVSHVTGRRRDIGPGAYPMEAQTDGSALVFMSRRDTALSDMTLTKILRDAAIARELREKNGRSHDVGCHEIDPDYQLLARSGHFPSRTGAIILVHVGWAHSHAPPARREAKFTLVGVGEILA